MNSAIMISHHLVSTGNPGLIKIVLYVLCSSIPALLFLALALASLAAVRGSTKSKLAFIVSEPEMLLHLENPWVCF